MGLEAKRIQAQAEEWSVSESVDVADVTELGDSTRTFEARGMSFYGGGGAFVPERADFDRESVVQYTTKDLKRLKRYIEQELLTRGDASVKPISEMVAPAVKVTVPGERRVRVQEE